MFCPNCSAQNSTEQKFCRSCGINLEKITESLMEQKPNADLTLSRQQQMLDSFGKFAFGGFGALVVGGIGYLVYMVIDKFILNGGNILAGLFFSLFILFALLGLIYVISNEIIKDKKKKANPHMDKELEGGIDTGKLLEPAQVMSVTEGTTELLQESRTRKLDQ